MTWTLHQGDCLEVMRTLPEASVQTCVTSPPYWGLRDYGVGGQIGLESSLAEYVEKLVAVFAEVRRGLREDGTLWLNLGDAFASNAKGSGGPSEKQSSNAGSRYGARNFDLRAMGLKPKDLCGVPWRVALALQADGWYLRSDIVWHKPNPMPESVTDRPTRSHEYVFLLSKSDRYFYDADAIREPYSEASLGRYAYAFKADVPSAKATKNPALGAGVIDRNPLGRNKRDVWTVATARFKDAHFATFPPALIEPCILAGSRPGDTVLDPFAGSGTTLQVAVENGREGIGIELSPAYCDIIRRRMAALGEPLPLEVAR